LEIKPRLHRCGQFGGVAACIIRSAVKNITSSIVRNIILFISLVILFQTGSSSGPQLLPHFILYRNFAGGLD